MTALHTCVAIPQALARPAGRRATPADPYLLGRPRLVVAERFRGG